jgi:hypothetical protein
MTIPQEIPKRIELAYKDALENIASIKKQQWIVTGYGFAIEAAIGAVARQLIASTCARVILTVLAIGVPIYGAFVLWGFYRGLMKMRGRLSWIYQHFFEGDEVDGMRLGQRPLSVEIIFTGGLGLSLFACALVASLSIWYSK